VKLFRLTAALLIAASALALVAPTASAQDYPGTVPPQVCTAVLRTNDALLPRARVRLFITCNQFINGHHLRGTGNSTPFALEPSSLVVDKTVSYDVTLPADFELNARHSVVLTDDDANGRLVANIPFFVNGKGAIANQPTSATTLARTGSSNHTGDLVKSGVVLLAFGGAAVRISRKRRTRTAAAV
jgi:hypothetical protein